MIELEVFDPRINDDFTITLEQNCFIVDFQGYPTRSKFLFKEISVYNNSLGRLAKRIILTTIACVLLVALVHDDSTTSLLTKLGG